jgi:hypothetical protein
VSSVGRCDGRHTSGVSRATVRCWKLSEHPAKSVLVGVADGRFGHRLAASIVLRPDSRIESPAARDYLKGKASCFE